MAEEMDVVVDRRPIPLVSLMERWVDGPILIYANVCMYVSLFHYIHQSTYLFIQPAVYRCLVYLYSSISHLCIYRTFSQNSTDKSRLGTD